MDLIDENLVKNLECAVCLDVFDEPKLLVCGHTVCQKCVNKVVATRQTGANADRNCIKCPECTEKTQIPPGGLKTNYRLVDLVCRAQQRLVDVYACNGCGKQAPVADMFTCETCQEALNTKPLWICAVCAMRQHRGHATSDCNKATQQQIQEACQGIADTGSMADVCIGLTMARLNGSLEKTDLISKLLNEQKCGFSLLQERVKSADKNLTQEDVAASRQEANDLKQKFEQASTIANEAGKDLESVLLVCRKKVEQLFLKELDEEPMEMEESDMSDEESMESEESDTSDEEPVEAEGSGTSRNNFDLSRFSNDQEAIELNECRADAIPDLSRFTKLEVLGLRNNLLRSINDNIIHASLTKLDLFENQITEIRGLDTLVNLEILDIGYNRLRKIEGLSNLANLKRLYLKYNKIEKIEGLDTLVNLEVLELDDNRIKAIENISHLSKLTVLSIPENRITKLENLETLVDLEELYVAEQGIETFDGIQNLTKLTLIDAEKNSIASLDHLGHLQQLDDLWLNDNKISQWPEVNKLAKLARLSNVSLEGNPIQAQDRDNYRRKVFLAVGEVTFVDGTSCR